MILERFKVPVKDQVFVSEAALRRTVTQIFEKLGLTPEDAAEGADVLTMTDLRGVETHGVSNMLRAYVRDYKAGKLDPRPGWRMVRESPGTAVIDAERRLGIIIGPKAMRLAVEKARRVGVGVVTVFNSGHFGALPTRLGPGSGSKNHFAAYNIEAFTDLEQFKDTMDTMLRTLRTAKPAAGQERVLYPGLSEAEEIQHRRAHGIPLHKEVIQWTRRCWISSASEDRKSTRLNSSHRTISYAVFCFKKETETKEQTRCIHT